MFTLCTYIVGLCRSDAVEERAATFVAASK